MARYPLWFVSIVYLSSPFKVVYFVNRFLAIGVIA